MLVKNKKIILGIIIVIIGIMIGVIPIFQKNKQEEKRQKIVNEYIENTTNENKIEKNDNKEELLLIIEIPKIELKTGVYPLNSSLNTIEKNVTIMKESSLPDEINGNVVLESHSGNASISYFKHLYKLNKNDLVNIYYQGIKYIYKIDDIYDVRKDGTVEINRDTFNSTLTLITCKKNTNDRQLVIISYLVNKEIY